MCIPGAATLAACEAKPDNSSMRQFALILAGGRSKRMGRPKEWLPFRGTTLLGHLAGTLHAAGATVAVVARDATQALPELPLDTVVAFDAEGPPGPLRGLVGGLDRLTASGRLGADDAVFLCACDAPFVSPPLLQSLADRLLAAPDSLAAVLRSAGKRQPFSALYRPAVLPLAVELLRQGNRSLQALLDRLPLTTLDADAWPAEDPRRLGLLDFDTPADYLQHLDRIPPSS